MLYIPTTIYRFPTPVQPGSGPKGFNPTISLSHTAPLADTNIQLEGRKKPALHARTGYIYNDKIFITFINSATSLRQH